MRQTHPLDHAANDLQQPDGGRMVVWSRAGRVRVAVLGSVLALAAGGAVASGAGGDEQSASAGQQSAAAAPAQPPDRSVG